MGNCLSGGLSVVEAPSSSRAFLPTATAVGVSNKTVFPAQNAGDARVSVCTAKWAANPEERTPAVVKVTPEGAFLALFEGLGERGELVASFCKTYVHEVFLDCRQQSPDLSAAMRATFAKLDERLLNSARLPAKVKAECGAAGVVAYLDFASKQCVVANVGHTHCLLGRIMGSFNAKLPEGFFLSADHTLRNKGERVRVHKRSLSDPEPAPATQVVGGVEKVAGVSELTRALGFGSCKQRAGAKPGSGTISCIAEVTEHRLTPTDQHLVIGSSGLWDVLGPQDTVLRLHLYEKHIAAEAAKDAAAAAAAEQDGGPAAASPSPSAREANTAEHLVLHAVSKLADRLTRKTRPAEPLSVVDLMHVPFERPPPLSQAEQQQPGARAQRAGSSSRQQWRQQQQGTRAAEPTTEAFTRRELHGDMAVVVVSLRWQHLSVDEQMQAKLAAAAVQRSAAGARGGGGAGDGAGGEYMRRLVRERWAQVRMLADFHRIYRRTLLRRWWNTADAVFREGKIKARVLPAAASPALKAPRDATAAPAAAAWPTPRSAAKGHSTPVRGTPGKSASVRGTPARGTPGRAAKASPSGRAMMASPLRESNLRGMAQAE